MILSSLKTAEQIASRMKYASVATQLSVSATINIDEKTTLTVNHKAQEVNMAEMFKSMNEDENE